MSSDIYAPRALLRILKRTGKQCYALPAEVEAAERAFYLSYLKPGMGYEIRNIVPGDPVFPGGQQTGKAEFSMHVATPVGR
jgi:hypothetical protein